MPVLHGVASWPGAIAVESCSYTLSHGISPGCALLKMLPQPSFPAEKGDLVITDGQVSITIPGCKVEQVLAEQGENGLTWSVAILDRRWVWRDCGQITGAYNQLDPHGKLIPWTIRSPYELAELCLKAMGETKYTIDMPPGYNRRDGIMHGQINPDHIGLTPRAGVNPPVDWQQEVPAQALQSLCEQLGRRVVYKLSTNSVAIVKLGSGEDLPAGGESIAVESPSLKSPAVPETIAVVGSPTKYQARFALEAVAEEWDGSYVPMDTVSYAPQVDGEPQVVKALSIAGTTVAANTFAIWLNAPSGEAPIEGVLFEATSTNSLTALTDLAAAINASDSPRIRGVVRAEVGTEGALDILTITGVQEGATWTFLARLTGAVTPPAQFNGNLWQAARAGIRKWDLSPPPLFPGVRATERLTLEEARALAQKSVYRCYRLTAIDPSWFDERWSFRCEARPVPENVTLTPPKPLVVPGFGRVHRRQQIVLLDTKVEQVTPEELGLNIVDPNLVGLDDGGGNVPRTINFYNGYSRDKPALVYGAIALDVARNAGFAFDTRNFGPAGGGRLNTNGLNPIYINFSIDPVEQLVVFTTHVYYMIRDRFYPIFRPVLETGCYIREADNNGMQCAYLARQLPGGQPGVAVIRKHPDIQWNIYSSYGDTHNVYGTYELEEDARVRARYYLDGLQAQFIYGEGLTREYNGIVSVDLDGAVQQVSWEVGGNGASTTASRNTEHSPYVPPFPARRRAEFLSPAEINGMTVERQRLGAGLMNGGQQ